MITMLKRVPLKHATNPAKGDVQSFLERLLVEVVSENYRYFLTEHLSFGGASDENTQTYCWPPLLANERQVSGLFAVGLSRVCPVSRPEHPIHRRRDEDDADELGRNGRIDFLATFGTRQIALELKRCKISTLGDAASKQLMQKQWETVVKQAKEALKHMREHKNLYKSPVSVGLLVIRVNRALGENPDKNKLNESVNALKEIAESVQKATQADFLAYYTSPQEMQISYGWGDKETRYQALPGVVFAAVVHGSTK